METTAEYAVESLAPATPLRVRPRVTHAARTDIGRVREHNEDKYEVHVPETEATVASRGAVYLVCDGMGGHAAGQIAAEIGAKTFIEVYFGHPATEVETALRDAAVAANRWVLDHARTHPGRKGMGATLSALIVLQDAAYTVQLGDSEIHRWRDGAFEKIVSEHNWTHEAMAQGSITAEEAAVHPWRHMLTRALGAEDACDPEVRRFDLAVGDRFLICSDGLTNHVPPATIGEVINRFGLGEAARSLVDLALADGGSDNCTVLLVRIEALEAVGV